MNGRVLTEAEIKLAARPLPPRYPPFPTNGTIEDISKYNTETVRIHQLGLKGDDPLFHSTSTLPLVYPLLCY
jgi:hypothetical protein